MGRKYQKPPIIEAVCEFRLSADTKWDLTIPGLIYERVKKDFPIKEERLIKEIELSQGPQGMKQEIRTNPRILFMKKDRKTFIQVGPNLLAVNCLKPYPTWDIFKPAIEHAFLSLADIVDLQGLQRIGLRYVNRIQLSELSMDLNRYFEYRPFLGKNLPEKVNSFIIGCVFPFFDERDACKIELTSAQPEKPNTSAFLLDIDYFLTKPRTISVDSVLQWIESGHDKAEEVFEGCIKDPLRKIFQEKQ